jgi:hypothetical protein
MATPTNSEIDAAILAVIQESWRKVAAIVSKAADKLGGTLPDGEDGCVMVAKRIKRLVKEGRLEAQGNLNNWRGSEVRLPVHTAKLPPSFLN